MSANNSFRSFFLSAFHCIDSNNNNTLSAEEISSAESWMFRFQYKHTSCDGSIISTTVSYNAANFRAAWNTSDFVLMEMANSPVGDTSFSWLGWDRNSTAPASSTGIHHPSADVMKISFDNSSAPETNYLSSSGTTHWMVNWDDGVTEGGSSGSPLLNQNKRAIGQLHGGYSGCSGSDLRDWYGCFYHSWTGGGTNTTRLSNWLDPCNTGTLTTNTLRSPYHSGPSFVCSSGTTFTVNNVPSGCTVYWDKSSNITLPADRTTNSIVAIANGTGTGWVRATINSTTCGSVILPQFQVYVNIPATPGTIGFRRAGGTCYYQAFISPVPGADSYDWSEDNVNWDLDYGTSYGLFDPNSTVTVYVRARNGCGVSPTKSKTQTMGNTPPDCMWRPVQIITDSTKSVSAVSDNIIIYPNPAKSEVTVCVSDVSPASDEDVNISSVAIIDSYGQTRKILHYGTGLKSVTINISDLPNGFYYISLNNNAAGKSYKLLIQK